MDADLQQIINNLQALANKLAVEGRLTEATVAWSGIIAVQALRTKIEPPGSATAGEAVIDEASESPEKKNAPP